MARRVIIIYIYTEKRRIIKTEKSTIGTAGSGGISPVVDSCNVHYKRAGELIQLRVYYYDTS